MRILLAAGDEHTLTHLMGVLEGTGHEIIPTAATGEELLATVERAPRLHAALLSQAALGRGWSKLLRQLRRQAPYLPAVVLLGPGAEYAWRRAMLAGAFDALPPFSEEAVLRALSCALAYSLGKSFEVPSLSLHAASTVGEPALSGSHPHIMSGVAR